MSVDQLVAVFSAFISFLGLVFVALQMREATKQRSLESLHQIYGINRELLSLGFSHPELFDIINDKPGDPERERRYLQMWLNQLSLIHSMLKNGQFETEFDDGLRRDIAGFMENKNMQSHWQYARNVYAASFQELVDDILKEAGAKKEVTKPGPDAQSAQKSASTFSQSLLLRAQKVGHFLRCWGHSPARKRRRRRSG